MNHTAYRHLSMPCPVMRGGLRFMLEGTEEFEVVGYARDGEEAVAVWAVGNGLLRRLAAGAHAATQLRRKLGDDANDLFLT